MSNPTLDDVFTRSERMIGRKVADDFLLVPIVNRGADADSLFDLNRVGAFLWEQFDGHRDGHAIVESLTDHFEVDHSRAGADYLEFVGKLLSVNALVQVTGSDTVRSTVRKL